MIICGRVQGGQNNASHWLAKFNKAYSRKTGMAIFPGSLNLCLEHDFDWLSFVSSPSTIRFDKEEYGGDRDILLLPCTLTNLDRRRAFLWTTTTAIRDRTSRSVIEIISDVKLREAYDLCDGSIVELSIAV